jgi:excisionase family DNA binding protein
MKDTPDYEPLLGVNEVARWLGISRTSVYDRVRAGAIPHVRIGHSIRFSRPHLERWILGGGDGGTPLEPPRPLQSPQAARSSASPLRRALENLGLSPATVTHLEAEHVPVEDLRRLPVRDMRKIAGIGRARLVETLTALGRADEIPDE